MITITTVRNGYIVSPECDPQSCFESSQSCVFETFEGMVRHLADIFGEADAYKHRKDWDTGESS